MGVYLLEQCGEAAGDALEAKSVMAAIVSENTQSCTLCGSTLTPCQGCVISPPPFPPQPLALPPAPLPPPVDGPGQLPAERAHRERPRLRRRRRRGRRLVHLLLAFLEFNTVICHRIWTFKATEY